MKAVVFHQFGGVDVLSLEEVPDPVPGPGEVLIDIGACALNHLDVDIREGVSRFPVEPPFILGIEVVGRIVALGAGVEGWKVGERVMPFLMATCGECRFCRSGRETLCVSAGFISFSTSGGYAEFLACSTAHLMRVPEELSDSDLAALQIAFGTAWHMLFTRGGLRIGETVLINSVGSGIGSAAVQLAHLAGATVIGNASSDDKLARASELGMDHGINHATQDVAAERHAADRRPWGRPRLRARGRGSVPGRARLARQGRSARDLRRARRRSRPVRHHPLLPRAEEHHRLLHLHPHRGRELHRARPPGSDQAARPATFPLAQARAAMAMMERRRVLRQDRPPSRDQGRVVNEATWC